MIYEQKKKIALQYKADFGRNNKIPNFENNCVFVFSGANQIKKNIGAMIDAFKILNNPECSLVLSLKPIDCQIGTWKYSGEYDLYDFAAFPNLFVMNQALSDPLHAQLFKMSDFLLYPSQGEAPGLQVSEAQLCGVIPLCTDYTGLPEESCFEEFLLKEFCFIRGQFNCYRAVISAEVLAEKMQMAFDFWKTINGEDCDIKQGLLQRYGRFMKDVDEKFRTRTWLQSAAELDSVFTSMLNNGMRVDLEMMKL